jgi:hypothetical protein
LALRDGQPRGRDGLPKGEAVLGAADLVDAGADQLHSVPIENPRVVQLDGEVQRRLPAQRRQERLGPLALDHLRDRLDVERLEIRRVGPLGVGHDRGRIRVDEHDSVALVPENPAGLSPGVVELARLPDPDRARADDQDRAKVFALRHVAEI